MCTVNWRLPTRALSTVKRDKTRTMMSNINARRMILIVCVLIGLSGCASEPRRPDASQSTRSRIGQIVDADTGQPIVGALVLNVSYLWPERGFGNFPVPKVFRDSAQALSDENGRFTITGPYDDLSWGPIRSTYSKPDTVPGDLGVKPTQGEVQRKLHCGLRTRLGS